MVPPLNRKMRPVLRSVLSTPPHSVLVPVVLAQRAPAPRLARFQSSSSSSSSSSTEPTTASLSPRWLSDVKARIGRCITFGLSSEQVKEAGAILDEVNSGWREMVAGSEGFLTGKDRWGLYRHQVQWGEMVCSP